MIVLPIINRGRIINVAVKLKTATKIANNISDFNIGPSDIIINHNKYSDSVYQQHTTTPKSAMEFIRSGAKVGKSSILVSTKENPVTGLYDIYEIPYLSEKVTDGIDNMIGTMLLDLKNESNSQKGRYLDLRKIGALDNITEDKLEKLKYASDNLKYMDVNKYIRENDLQNLFKTLEIFNMFDFTILKKSIIPLEEFNNIMNFLEPTNSKDYNNLKHYYDIAKSNQEEYSKLSYLNKIVNNKSLNLIHSSKEKVKVYSSDEHQDDAA